MAYIDALTEQEVTLRDLPLRKSRLKRWKNQKNRVLTWPLIRLILLKTHRFRLYTACM